MDATMLLPTPRKVLRALRWGFDVLLWAEDATRRVVCEVTSPFSGPSRGGVETGAPGPSRAAAAAAPAPVVRQRAAGAGAPAPSGAGTGPVPRPRSVATYGPPAAEVSEVAPQAPAAPAGTAGEDAPRPGAGATSGAQALAAGVLPEGVLAAPLPEPRAAEEVAAGRDSGDDLTRINGIGPRIAERLAHSGVTTFAQLAGWDADDIARFEAQLPGVQRGKAERDSWIAQARELAGADPGHGGRTG